MKNAAFNHDRFNTMQKCRKMYYFKYLKELRFPEFHNDYELGNETHALIDYHLRGFDTEPLVKNAKTEVKEVWNRIKTDPIMNKQVIKTEPGFDVPVPGTQGRLIGRIDAIFYDEEENKYVIADWKTGKFIPQQTASNFQHKVYLYAFYKSRKDFGLDFKPEDLCFRYYKILPDEVETVQYDFSAKKLTEYEEMFRGMINDSESFNSAEIPDICPVRNCDYRGLCAGS